LGYDFCIMYRLSHMIEVVFTWNIYWWVVLVLASCFILFAVRYFLTRIQLNFMMNRGM